MNAIEHICKALGLPKDDSFTQDWAYELPESFRTKEWLNKYIAAYLNGNDLDSKKLLMELMLDIINDFINQNINHESTSSVLDLLFKNYNDHLLLIDYWSLDEENLDNCFALTPYIRKIKSQSWNSEHQL